MSKTSKEQIIAELDVLTKQGQKQHVLKELIKILKNSPPKPLLPQLARLANRNHAYVLALRILHPLIRDDREQISEASPEVLNIYATSLMWIGALEESHQCLQRIKLSTEALLTGAFIHFARWNYHNAIPLLIKYVNSSQIDNYQKLVGQINLLAAFVATGNLKQARSILETLLSVFSENPSYKLLLGNCLELRAQIEILENSYDKALLSLTEAERSLADQPGRYLLYVNKWRSIAQLGLSPQDSEAHSALAQVKQDALKLRNWETLRDCDFHLARLTQNNTLLQRILLGTPYQGYHDRIQSTFGITVTESRNLEYCPGDVLAKPRLIGLDLDSISENSLLNSTSWPLLQLITRDIYRPPRMGVVFSELYKNEYFNPFTSPQRVRNSVFRFNEWAKDHTNSFHIKISQGDFLLMAPIGLSVSSTRRERPLDSWQAALKFFKLQNNSRSFTSSDLAKVLGITQRSALNILKKALASRKVQKINRGKNCRYIFFSGRRTG